MNRLTFRRMAGAYDLDTSYELDLAVPVIDGVPLHERMAERFYGIDVELVAPPSSHLLGAPSYVEDGLPVILDGGCLVAGCCGVMVRVTINERTVVWSNFFARGQPDIPADLKFTYDRNEYERALSSVSTLEPEPFPDDD